jgi:hypothetical protein
LAGRASGGTVEWKLAKEPSNARDGSVVGQFTDVDTTEGYRAVRRDEIPGEAEVIVVRIDPTGSDEAVVRELRLQSRCHVADFDLTRRRKRWIDQTAV